MVLEACPEVRSAPPGEWSAADFPDLRELVVWDPANPSATRRPAPGFRVWDEVLELGRSLPDRALPDGTGSLDPDDPINIQFTSGTTGFPKPVVLTHHNILNNGFFDRRQAMSLTTEADRICIPVPFYHCFGMVISNARVRLSHGCDPGHSRHEHFDAKAPPCRRWKTERCTVLHGVPTMFVAELERPGLCRASI